MYSKTSTSVKVAIGIPIYKNDISADEFFAIRHLTAHLENYDKYLVAPEGLPIPDALSHFLVIRFPKLYFENIRGYNQLMLSLAFYQAFESYDYLLIYQLDALVFSDQLQAFCDMGFDYIGAPWFNNEENPKQGLSRVGNGGLSLRKVDAFMRVLSSKRYQKQSLENFFAILDH